MKSTIITFSGSLRVGCFFIFVMTCLSAGSPVFAYEDIVEGNSWNLRKLDNGFTIILKEDHSCSMAGSIITVKAGAVYEDSTTLGLTHFLEHLLFDGTASRSREELWNGIQKRGGYINAFTRRTATVFILLMPSSQFSDGLEIQADMLLDSVIPEKELSKERKVVIEEILQSLDSPGESAERICTAFFFKGTSYTEPVLGYRDLIESVPHGKILTYYKKMYVPANMTAICMGDIDADAACSLYQSFFGKIPGGEPVEEPPELQPYCIGGEVIEEKGDFIERKLEIAWVAPGIDEKFHREIELLARTLGSGEASPLGISLRAKPEISVLDVRAWQENYYGFSLFRISVSMDDPAETASVLKAVLAVTSELGSEPLSPKDLAIARAALEAETCRYEEKYHHFGMIKGVNVALGGPSIVIEGSVFDGITADAVSAAAAGLFEGERYRAVILEPERKDRKKSGRTGMGAMMRR